MGSSLAPPLLGQLGLRAFAPSVWLSAGPQRLPPPRPAPHDPTCHCETPKDTLSVCQSPWSAGPAELENGALVTICGDILPQKKHVVSIGSPG